jgi:hypothetical protein
MKTLILVFSVLFTTMSFAQVPSYVPANGLVGWWPFNGNADDQSGNGNNGTNNGATLTTDRNGNVNSAYSFDGNSGITIPHSTSLNIGSSCTFSFWLKYNNLSNGFNLVFKKGITGGCPDSGYYFAFDGIPGPAHKCFGYGVTGNCSSISDSEYLDNQWHNIIVVYNLQNSQIYFDGVLQDGDANSNLNQTISNTIEPLIIGYYSGPYSGTSWNGLIDDFGIWNRALTQQEITNLYTSTVPVSCLPAYVPTSGLVGYWPFCGNANDESGNGNNGTNNGATLTTDRNGNVNSAYSFLNQNSKISLSTITSDSLTSISISGWFKKITAGVDGTIFAMSNGCFGADGPRLFIGNDNFLYWQVEKTSCIGFGVYSNQINYSDNNWHFFAAIYTKTNPTYVTSDFSLYVDGINIGLSNPYSTQGIISPLSNNFFSTTFGNTNTNLNGFTGLVDDIGIWNRALTDCEIQNLYTSTNPTNTTTASACNSYTWNGTSYTASGVYTGTSTDCVTESLDLTITPSSTNTTTASACDSYTWNGTTYTATGVFTGTTTDCVTQSLNLTITPSSTNTSTASACDSYTWNGTNYTESGVYTGTTANCVTESLDLTITPSSTNTTTATACDSYLWNETNYTTSGVYTGTTANCITESLNLTITPSSTNTTSQTACDYYTWNGTAYTASGVFTGTTANCVTQALNLTIIDGTTNTTTITACGSYVWNGTTYTSSGEYTGTTANCVTQALNLTITPSSTNTTTASACDSYVWNGTTYTASGVYTGTTTNCVTQALNLTINTNTSSSISQTALDSYTWPVNNQTYTTTGAYTAVIPNASGCDSTITLNLTMSFTGINELSASKLSIYPNPTNGDFTIRGLELLGTVSSLSLTDMNGKVVKVLDTKATKFSMGSIKPGVYFLNIISGNKQEVLKIVKE